MGPGRELRRPAEGLARVRLAHLPTPLEDCPRIVEALGGPRILVKRDDCTGLGGGGNKVRKLEFVLGAALAQGVDTVVTFGAVQSNHARQTAAACAHLGLGCELILTRSVACSDPSFEELGNPMLDRIFGARLHVVDGPEAAASAHQALTAEAAAAGTRLLTVPPGGSDATGVMGYAEAGWELDSQLPDGLTVDRVVVAASTGGTAAGLLVGMAALDSPRLGGAVLEVVCVHSSAPTTEAEIRRLCTEAAHLVGTDPPGEARLRVLDEWIGPGYGIPSEEGIEAASLFARLEGLLLDPVYTAKAAAGLLSMVGRGEIGAGETVVFVHTGGWPVLPAYRASLGI
jgi:D-cysteine desulfhydrase family pyridoxal phosphate-dependent enzyme